MRETTRPARRQNGTPPLQAHALTEPAARAFAAAGIRLETHGPGRRLGVLGLRSGRASLRDEDGWIVADLPAPRALLRMAEREGAAAILRAHDRLPACVKLCHREVHPGDSDGSSVAALLLRIEVPPPVDDADEDHVERRIEWLEHATRALRRAANLRSADFRATAKTTLELPPTDADRSPDGDPMAGAGATSDDRTAATQESAIAQALGPLGWSASPHAAGGLRVELRNPNGGFRMATIVAEADNARLTLDLAADLPDGAPSAITEAAARLLLRTATAVRLVRPFARAHAGFGLEARIPVAPSPRSLDLALTALSVAVSMSASEVEALVSDAGLARSYLSRWSLASAGFPFGGGSV